MCCGRRRERLSEDGGVSIGYARDVILPLHVVPQDPGKPVTLKLKLDYAICEKMCVPAEAKAELTLTSGRGFAGCGADRRRGAACRKHAQALGEGQALADPLGPARDRAKGPRVVVDVAAPTGAVDLFAEGPTPQWALPVPAPVDGAPDGIKRFAFDLDGAPPGAELRGCADHADRGRRNRAAIEVAIRLD